MGDDKKPSKSRSNTPRDRDVFVPKRATAPYGVPVVADTSPPRGEDWETPDTGTRDVPRPRSHGGRERERDDDTPIGLETADAEAEFRLRNRVKETNTNVKAVKAAAEVGTATIRTEMQGHVTRLEGKIEEVKTEAGRKIDELGGKVETLGNHVLGAMGTVNTALVTLGQFQGVVAQGETEKTRTTWEAHTAIATNQQKLADKDAADAKRQLRSFWYRVGAGALKIAIAVAMIAATAIATHYAERC